MKYIKFEGIFKKISENQSPGFDLISFLQKELNISKRKAELLGEKIRTAIDFSDVINEELSQRNDLTISEKYIKKNFKFNIYSLDNLSGKEFEEFLKWFFEELGYKVELTKSTADSGVDLVLNKDDDRIAVQAKRYNRNTKISNTVVLKTHGGMAIYKCQKSIIITTSYFTNQAKNDAQKLNIDLWDRETLSANIDEINNKNTYDNNHKIKFPNYKTNLYKSLLNLKSMDIFQIEKKKDKYDIYKHGIKYPIISFRESFGTVVHLSFRIKKNQPIPEYGPNSWSLITSDRGNTYGPEGEVAYFQITEYLSQFV